MEVEEGPTSSWCDEMNEPAVAAVPATPRQRRALAQPQRLEEGLDVLCHTYSQVRDAGVRWQGRTGQGCAARLCYFLPENWSPSYKYTIFEDSYVLQFAPTGGADGGAASSSLHYHLARQTQQTTSADGSRLAEFELVWPVPLDVTLMEAVTHACDRLKPGTKRKPHDTSMSAVHQKLRKLGL